MSAGRHAVRLWFVLKGETEICSVQMDADSYVEDFKACVKAKYPDKLSNLTPSQIKIYIKKGNSQAQHLAW